MEIIVICFKASLRGKKPARIDQCLNTTSVADLTQGEQSMEEMWN